MEQEIIVITGPTACGKTGRAVELAKILDGEIISADSRQVYTGMDLGTGKDLDEYGDVPYHLIDIAPAGSKYNLHNYLADFSRAEADIKARNKRIIVCGGTGLYLESALSGIVLPEVGENRNLRKSLSGKSLTELTEILSEYKVLHNTTDVDSCQRAIRAIEIEEYYKMHPEAKEKADRRKAKPRNAKIFLLDISRDLRRERISTRLEKRLNEGMIEEVRKLLESGIPPVDLIYYGLEYKYLTLYLVGDLSYEEMKKRLEIEIHKFAKRQMTWFRGMERRGFNLIHIPYDLPASKYPL
ncbi:MAG: tRNA (adenosine(37)-N6)-dimethylallyltransferase MiaA [Muribaculaceae bacterium]|nr:tRNA (adenosine(37)-N6)-dimethylallyltransferase MiaA [Muribaculaceae bacterium]